MFSTAQTQVVQSLVNTMVKQGYKYYVAYTNTTIGYNTTTSPDLYIYFCSEEISAVSAYRYSIPAGSILYTCRTANYSTSQTAVNTDRIVRSAIGNAYTLNINVYEHVYTNSVTQYSEVVQPEVFIEGSEGNALQGVTCLILSITLFFSVFWKMWQIRK